MEVECSKILAVEIGVYATTFPVFHRTMMIITLQPGFESFIGQSKTRHACYYFADMTCHISWPPQLQHVAFLRRRPPRECQLYRIMCMISTSNRR